VERPLRNVACSKHQEAPENKRLSSIELAEVSASSELIDCLFGLEAPYVVFLRDVGLRLALPIHRDEMKLVTTAVPKRKREFVSGRSLCKAALSQFGYHDQSILQNSSRAPIWPDDIVGSISHCDWEAAVVLANSKNLVGVGLDVELDQPLIPEVEDSVCNSLDRRLSRKQSALRDARWSKVIFCAKESVFKALNPLTSEVPDFKDVAVFLGRSLQRDAGWFTIYPAARFEGFKQFAPYCLGRWCFHQGRIFAVCSVTVDLWYMRLEETVMRETFGAEYDAYCREMRGWL
jgi:4'-phosphopantetheinyl transferase EntD